MVIKKGKGFIKSQLIDLEQNSMSYIKGYQFHQNHLKSSPDLLEWVLQDNYFDDLVTKLPKN